MPAWARALLSSIPQGTTDDGAIREALQEVRASGTGLVGDIANTSVSVWPLVESGVDAVVFKELLGFNEQHPEERVAHECEGLSELQAQIGRHAHGSRVELCLSAHAPYSVSPGLFRAIRAGMPRGPLCLHMAESREEIEFLRRGTGPWRDVLEERGRWMRRGARLTADRWPTSSSLDG
jgi:5-methylthioadenosine/S-adenosylhomocysteine deaminase